MKLSIEGKVELDTDEPRLLFNQGRYSELSAYFLGIFHHFTTRAYLEYGPALRQFVNAFMEQFLYLFPQPEYVLEEEHAVSFIRSNAAIANLAALSDFQTTDAQIGLLRQREHNFLKILALYSARNTLRLDRKKLFDANPQYASLWYSRFFDLYYTALADAQLHQRMREHLAYFDPRYRQLESIARIFFGCTYIDGAQDKVLKQHLNKMVQETIRPQVAIVNNPNPKKIAVFSACWRPTHAVFKNQYLFLKALKEDYELTFFSLRDKQETGMFHHVDRSFESGQLNLDVVRNNDFALAYYPDVGMSEASVILANLRLAPIQVCSFGHSVSTFGADIDYYIAGEDIELAEAYEENYSERLVLLPGLGIVNKPPPYELRRPKKTRDEVLINCSWSSQKCNSEMLRTLRRILEGAKRPVVFRMFVGSGVYRDSNFLPFVADMKRLLGARHVEIVGGLAYAEYLSQMEEGDFSIDSYHFGGCNTIIDSLHVEKPIIARRGTKWYNRTGPAQLVAAGFPELVADSEEAYIELVDKLIHDDDYLRALAQKISLTNWSQSPLFSDESAKHFKCAIDYLMTHHAQLKAEGSKVPIVIES